MRTSGHTEVNHIIEAGMHVDSGGGDDAVAHGQRQRVSYERHNAVLPGDHEVLDMLVFDSPRDRLRRLRGEAVERHLVRTRKVSVMPCGA